MTDTLMPIGISNPLLSIRLFKTSKNGKIKMLNAAKDTTIPLMPNLIEGVNKNHAKTQALIGISDHEKLPEIAKSQIAQVMIPSTSIIEKTAEKTVCIDLTLLFAAVWAYCRALLILSSGLFITSSLFRSPFSNSLIVMPRISESGDKSEASGQLSPRSHFDTALSLTCNFNAKSFCVICCIFRNSEMSCPIFLLSMKNSS